VEKRKRPAESIRNEYVIYDITAYVTKLLQMSEYTSNPDYKLMTDKLQLV